MATKIIMFTKNECPHCKRAKHFLGFAPVEIELEERNIDKDIDYKNEADDLGIMSLPAFKFENGNIVRGFEEGKIMNELGL
ncbi:NrdH-redoxin [Bacillus pseudomycoides]|uniref:glutaredoxin family protein n=1 Tax=Bacillus pseudomycoides TaxID=64104 RepID=UPI000BEB9E80|nr:glutaredoxin family protein [Bacillus pseudomycoides]MBD5797774.1 NrdH-redoxin [Bacillus pseudomycoides]PDZ12291.1 NrdH-redoxin [Bacillus pseudomycoides]PEP88588.1 NrdH-redoxin [Bacillus pseudomycoides]PFW97426.1 NrdH-redoxin [Bacillus pseudomycoides]PFX37914.1 NrdH-redoxin [Bacillus pseudomycoides]